MQSRIAPVQLLEFLHGDQIPEHAVDAICQVPDAVIVWSEVGKALIECLHVAVPHYFHVRHVGAHKLHGHLHAMMNLLVQDHCIAFLDERRDGRQVSQGRGRRDHDGGSCDALQQVLQLAIGRGRKVGPGRGELRAIAQESVDRSLLEAWVHFQAEITT